MSTYIPERLASRGINLADRIVASTTVVASPTANAETIIASVSMPAQVQVFSGILLVGFAAYTVGTSGDGVNLKLRQTDTSGTTVSATGLVTSTATDLEALSIVGFDTAPAEGQVYKLTMTVHSGAAASTVSAVTLAAISV